MKNRILYIDNDSFDPYFSFGLEYYLTTEKCFEDRTVFLFWRTAPTLMLGKYQNIYEEINLKYAERKNINIVRRMSGGGTIYTDQGGWQYSFITRDLDSEISFVEYIEPVIEALAEIGINAQFNGRNDLVIDNRKFSGTAQYKHNGYTVHHGSLLYDTDIEEMVKSTSVDEHKITSKGIKSIRDRVTNISEHMAEPVGNNEFKQLIVKHITGNDGEIYELNQYDLERIDYYACTRFNNKDSIFEKNPPFAIKCKGHFLGGNMQIRLDVVKGVIIEADISGDFFASVDKDTIENCLKGCKYDKKAVLTRLNENRIDKMIYRISAEDIAGCMF